MLIAPSRFAACGDVRFWQKICPSQSGRTRLLWPGNLDVNLLHNCECVIHLNAELPKRCFRP